jgi:hypothetical protein
VRFTSCGASPSRSPSPSDRRRRRSSIDDVKVSPSSEGTPTNREQRKIEQAVRLMEKVHQSLKKSEDTAVRTAEEEKEEAQRIAAVRMAPNHFSWFVFPRFFLSHLFSLRYRIMNIVQSFVVYLRLQHYTQPWRSSQMLCGTLRQLLQKCPSTVWFASFHHLNGSHLSSCPLIGLPSRNSQLKESTLQIPAIIFPAGLSRYVLPPSDFSCLV